MATVDTSKFTPEQLTAYNNALAQVPGAKPAVLTPAQLAAQNTTLGRTQFNTAPAGTPISASTLSNPQSLITVPPAQTTNFSGTVANTNAILGANTSALTPTTDTTATPSGFEGLLKDLINQPAPASAADTYTSLYGTAGIDTKQQDFAAKQQAVLDAQSRLSSVNARLKGLSAEAEAAKLASAGRRAPEFVISGEQGAIDRSLAIKALPLQVEALGAQAEVAAAQGNAALSQSILNQANDHLDRVFQITMTDAQNQYNYKKDIRDKVYQYATAAEKTKLEKLQKEDDRKFELTKIAIKNKDDIASAALSNGDAASAAKISALNPDSPTFQADLARLQGQIKPKVDVNATRRATNIASTIATLTPQQASDPLIKTLINSSGGKPLTDTPLTQLNKGITVLGQLGVLQNSIQNTDTGPIVGLFRGANPWDTNAQSIKAQLNAIVPNLARGIYGEVGVLTDNDIAQYSKTLPNLKSTDDLRSAVLYITVDQIGKSIANTLRVQAAGGRDVSGFVDLYTEMQKTKDSILSQLNVPITPEDNNIYASVVPAATGGGGIGGFFSDIWKGLTGK